MMDICSAYASDPNGPGSLLRSIMDYCLSHDWFAESERGALTRIAFFMKRPVQVRPDLTEIYDKEEATVSCVLEAVSNWYHTEWEIAFCFYPFQTISRRGTLSELSKLFIKLGSNFSAPADQWEPSKAI